jgi:energy-converting hydrogenase Eha subunit C
LSESIEELKPCRISVSLFEYGLIAVIASWAFFNLAAETIFMALVICIVEDTDEILFLISFKLAIISD